MSPRFDLYLLGRKGERVLQALVDSAPSAIAGVITARDAGVDDDRAEAISALAARHGIAVRDRKSTGGEAPAYALAIGWRWLIDLPRTRLIVLHDSLLPRYRGFNPLVSCLINGEREIGVTALLASAEYDRGPILGQKRLGVTYPLRITQAIDLIAPLYAALAAEIVGATLAGEPLEGVPQDEASATYSLWRDEADYRIDWSQSADRIARLIHAVGTPYAGAQTEAGGRMAIIDDAVAEADVKIENRAPGKVIFMREGQPAIVCGEGLLRVVSGRWQDDGSALLPLPGFRARFT